MNDREFYLTKLKKAEEDKVYFSYGRDYDAMSLEELRYAYTDMRNWLSDVAHETALIYDEDDDYDYDEDYDDEDEEDHYEDEEE